MLPQPPCCQAPRHVHCTALIDMQRVEPVLCDDLFLGWFGRPLLGPGHFLHSPTLHHMPQPIGPLSCALQHDNSCNKKCQLIGVSNSAQAVLNMHLHFSRRFAWLRQLPLQMPVNPQVTGVHCTARQLGTVVLIADICWLPTACFTNTNMTSWPRTQALLL
jgi:hypothetical protein